MNHAHRPGHVCGGDSAVALSVIVPCFQEEANIDTLVCRTLATFDTLKTCDATQHKALSTGQESARTEARASRMLEGPNSTTELMLIDDGSGDGTWSRIEHWLNNDARVRGVRHDVNTGIVSAWRTGLMAARGGLVCLIDADLQNRPEDIPRLLDRLDLGDCDIAQGVRHSATPS